MSATLKADRGRAAAVAALLMLAGAALGVTVDRLLLSPPAAAAMPLTPEALIAHLQLGPQEEVRVRVLLDSLHEEVSSAATTGPAALEAVAERAHQRLEQALPPDARPAFRQWVNEHHAQMTERMHGGAMHRQMHRQH